MPHPAGRSILVLCTANRCRSPMAAALLRHASRAAGLGWAVDTAGVRTQAGDCTDSAVLTVLEEVGIAAEARPARQVDAALLRAADLVLTAERAHRSAVLGLVPELVGRVFTLLEFERLLTAAAPARAPGGPVHTPLGLARIADSARALAGPSRPADDLADPIGAPIRAYRECRDSVERVVERIVRTATG